MHINCVVIEYREHLDGGVVCKFTVETKEEFLQDCNGLLTIFDRYNESIELRNSFWKWFCTRSNVEKEKYLKYWKGNGEIDVKYMKTLNTRNVPYAYKIRDLKKHIHRGKTHFGTDYEIFDTEMDLILKEKELEIIYKGLQKSRKEKHKDNIRHNGCAKEWLGKKCNIAKTISGLIKKKIYVYAVYYYDCGDVLEEEIVVTTEIIKDNESIDYSFNPRNYRYIKIAEF